LLGERDGIYIPPVKLPASVIDMVLRLQCDF